MTATDRVILKFTLPHINACYGKELVFVQNVGSGNVSAGLNVLGLA